MLATMTPVSVIEYEEQEAAAAAGQKTVIYLPPGQNHQETVIYDHTGSQTLETSNGPVSVVVQQPGAHILNQTAATYQGPPGTTVLVLSELVEDMSPLLGLR